jgi:hypothetical protein
MTLWLPLGGSGPFHPPLAVQDVALVEDHVKMTGCPANALAELGERVTVGGVVTTVGGAGDGEGELLPPHPTSTKHSHGMMAGAQD